MGSSSPSPALPTPRGVDHEKSRGVCLLLVWTSGMFLMRNLPLLPHMGNLIQERLFFYKNNIFTDIFGCAGSLLQFACSSLMAQAFSSCIEHGLLSSCGAQASHCGGFSCFRAQALGSQASVVVAQELSCPIVCGIFSDQGSKPCPLNWQVDS